jgi:hypothetical protein
MQPAIALLEFDSIAVGMRAGDAMVKRAPVEVTYAGTVHPGKYLVLVGGDVASVEESYGAGLTAGGDAVIDRIFLPSAHPDISRYLRGMRGRVTGEAPRPPPSRPHSAPPIVGSRAPRSIWSSSSSPIVSAARPTASFRAPSPTPRRQWRSRSTPWTIRPLWSLRS